ncbi:hypothetical protein [Pleionea sediminis]|uniref:hypothetical protein n=1 Tax=Pleionea sediminis TaxID=2569479 RepID=UPI00118617AE|nr:hypothetical protein [Pleionea sediminis]
MSTEFEVEIDVVMPFKVKVKASDSAQAFDLAEDAAMDHLDLKITNSREFEAFWENDVSLLRRKCEPTSK